MKPFQFIYGTVALIGMVWGLYLGLYLREEQPSNMPVLAIVLIAMSVLMAVIYLLTNIVRIFWAPFAFFPDRASLHAEDQTLNSAQTIWALCGVAQKIYNADNHMEKIKRLLLPNPNNESFAHFMWANSDKAIKKNIRDITIRATASGVQVRWYDHFVHDSMNLVDTDKMSGWVDIEAVLPHSEPERCPSYRVYKRGNRPTVEEMRRIYLAIWKDAQEPTAKDLEIA